MSLDIAITKTPVRKPVDSENFDTGRYIGVDEWYELFHKTLKIPEISPNQDESFIDFENRRKRLFQDNMTNKGYKMLGRIWYYFSDAFYDSSEVSRLLEECLEIQKFTQSAQSKSAIENLIFACNEALKVKSGIWLISD